MKRLYDQLFACAFSALLNLPFAISACLWVHSGLYHLLMQASQVMVHSQTAVLASRIHLTRNDKIRDARDAPDQVDEQA